MYNNLVLGGGGGQRIGSMLVKQIDDDSQTNCSPGLQEGGLLGGHVQQTACWGVTMTGRNELIPHTLNHIKSTPPKACSQGSSGCIAWDLGCILVCDRLCDAPCDL